MRGGGKWIQHKDGGWIYQLSNKNLKIGARSKKTTRQKEEGEVNSVVKPSFDWLDTSNLGKTRDEMTDFDIKEIADADNSNIGYITTSGAIPEEQQKQQMREVELDASKDNRLRWVV